MASGEELNGPLQLTHEGEDRGELIINLKWVPFAKEDVTDYSPKVSSHTLE